MVAALTVWLLAPAPALAQGEPKYLGWSKLENAREMREFKEKLRDGLTLYPELRDFLRQTVLPQLGLEENRSTIERTRRRMREVLLTEIEDDKAFVEVSRLFADYMTTLARDDAADMAVRLNAMLFVGEMRGKDGKPWPQVRPALAAATGDVQLPIAVRIAAIAAIRRHVEACRGDAAATAALSKAAGPAIMTILSEKVASDRRAEQEWLASQAVSILPALVPTASKDVAAALSNIIDNPTRATDMRVRAAAALGAMANANSEVNAAKLIETLRGIAVQALEADVLAADIRRFERQYRILAAGQQAAMQPGGAPAGGSDPAADNLVIPEQACRRNAWRLVTLADAIDPGDGRPGLAALLGPSAAPAQQLAATLRDAGLAIDQTPDEESVVTAIKAIKAPAQAPAGGAAPAQPAAAPQQETEQGPAAQPAGAPNASPFDSPF